MAPGLFEGEVWTRKHREDGHVTWRHIGVTHLQPKEPQGLTHRQKPGESGPQESPALRTPGSGLGLRRLRCPRPGVRASVGAPGGLLRTPRPPPGPASPPPASPWLARVSFWKSCILSALRLLSWTEKGADASSSRVTRGGRRRRVPSTGRGGGRNRAARPAPALTLPGSVQALQSKRKRASLLEDRVL